MPNPIFPGWYADPEIHCFDGRYYVYPTTSAPFEQQLHYECWSSDDLIEWRNQGIILSLLDVRWSTNFAAWAPSCARNPRDGKYYFYFSAGNGAGIGVAVSANPFGPFVDAIGIPLVRDYFFGAQPIDAHCFVDDDNYAYLYYGGHGHCVVAPLTETMQAVMRAPREVTPSENYVEGPFMVKRRGVYYMMWSEGGWGDASYRVAYGRADNPFGPFEYRGVILENNPDVATSAGHHSVMQLPNTEDDWVICYHRRPLGETDANHRVTCLEKLEFHADGSIAPVTLSFEGVAAHPIGKLSADAPYKLSDA